MAPFYYFFLFGIIVWMSWLAVNNPTSYKVHNAETQQARQNKEPKESLWRPSTWEPVTFFTWALVVVGTGQAALFLWQLRLIRDGANDARLAAYAARKAADAAVEQTKLARDEFQATHRPKLIVRRIEMIILNTDCPIVIRYTFVNVGEIQAEKTVWSVDCILVKKGKIITGRTTYRAPAHPHVPFPLPSGDFCEFDFKDNVPLTLHDMNAIKCGEKELLFFGRVAYQDPRGITRRTGFVRRYSPETYRFHLTDDPDNEYQD